MTAWRAVTAMLFLLAPAARAGDRPPPALAAQEARAVGALGDGYVARAQDGRLILACPSCEGTPMVELSLGRQEDGTEARLRSGQTMIDALDRQCRARNPTCRVERADIGAAVGWVSAYRAGAIAGSTLVLLRDGAMVIARSVSASPELARGNIDRLRAEVLPALAGP